MLEEERSCIRALTDKYLAQTTDVLEKAQKRIDMERHKLEEEKKILKQQQLEFELKSLTVAQYNAMIEEDGIVSLNIGGTRYQSSKQVLCADPQSIFVPLLSGQFLVEKDDQGYIFIDREPTLFPFILDYLRRLYSATIPRKGSSSIVASTSTSPPEAAAERVQKYNIINRMTIPSHLLAMAAGSSSGGGDGPDPAIAILAEAEYYGVDSLVSQLRKDSYRRCWVGENPNNHPYPYGHVTIRSQKENVLRVHTEYVLCALLWEDAYGDGSDHRVFFGSADASVSECSVRSLGCRHTTTVHHGFVTAIERVDAHHFVTASRDCTLKLWRVPSPTPTSSLTSSQPPRKHAFPIASLEQHSDFVFDVCVVPSKGSSGCSVTLASSGNDKVIHFWHLSAEILDPTLIPPTGDVSSSVVGTPIPSGASADLDNAGGGRGASSPLAILTPQADRCYRHERLPLKALICFEGFLYVVCEDAILVIDPTTCTKVDTLTGHKGVVRCLTACPIRRLVITGGWDRSCRVWPVLSTTTSGGMDGSTAAAAPPTFAPPAILEGHSSWISDIAVYGDYLVCSAAKSIYFYDLTTTSYQLRRKVDIEHEDLIRCFVMTAAVGEPSTLITGSFDCTARMVQATPGQQAWQVA